MRSRLGGPLFPGTGGLLLGFFAVMGIAGDPGPRPEDARVHKVEAFFDSYGCPEPYHAAEYVRAADEFGVDFRLLPAISVLETTCGTHQRRNNHWGWNSARTGFKSVAAGIRYVTRQLGHGKRYREHNLEGKLYTYNPRSRYVAAAKRLMQEIQND